MHNKFQVTRAKQKSESHARLDKKLYPRKNPFKTEQMALNSLNRIDNWTKSKLFHDQTLEIFNKGTIPLLHTDLHDFRGRDKSKELSKTEFLSRHYLPATQRAEEVSREFRSSHLDQTPFKDHNYFLEKSRSPEKEIGPLMRIGERTEDERVFSNLNGTNRLIDHSPRDLTMIISPRWKDDQKNKWPSPKNFTVTGCHYKEKRFDDPWPMIPFSTNVGDPYVDGFDVTGDVSRKRNKKLEISVNDFMSTVSPTKTSNYMPPINSNSIRTSKSVNFFEMNQKGSPRIYPNSLRQVVNADPMNLGKTPSSPFSNDPVIQIQSGSPLATLKESPYSTKFNTKFTGDKFPDSANRTTRKSDFFNFKKMQNLKSTVRNEYIKQRIKSYFE